MERFEIKSNSDFGRSLFSLRDFDIGEILMVEDPFVFWDEKSFSSKIYFRYFNDFIISINIKFSRFQFFYSNFIFSNLLLRYVFKFISQTEDLPILNF